MPRLPKTRTTAQTQKSIQKPGQKSGPKPDEKSEQRLGRKPDVSGKPQRKSGERKGDEKPSQAGPGQAKATTSAKSSQAARPGKGFGKGPKSGTAERNTRSFRGKGTDTRPFKGKGGAVRGVRPQRPAAVEPVSEDLVDDLDEETLDTLDKKKGPRPAAPKLPPTSTRLTKQARDRSGFDPMSGRVAIVGQPNVGKSTLLNALIGTHLAIATSKPGTTRSVLLAVYQDSATQIAFLDTPGLESPRTLVGRALVETAQGATDGVDAVLWMVDAQNWVKNAFGSENDRRIRTMLAASGKPVVLCINKIDKLEDKVQLLPLLVKLSEEGGFADLVPVSARLGDNIDAVIDALRPLLHSGKDFDDDFLTDRPERFFVAEYIREAVLELTHQEIPYGCAVQIDKWERNDSRTKIAATLITSKDSHKPILLGKGGANIKAIGQRARASIESFVGGSIYLELFVRVDSGWTEKPHRIGDYLEPGSPTSGSPTSGSPTSISE